MRPKTISDEKLLELIDSGVSQASIAKELGVSRQAIHFRLRELRGKHTMAICASKIERVVDQKLDSMAQLHRINDDANELLDRLLSIITGDKTITSEMTEAEASGLAIKTMAEIRAQLHLQLDIFATLFDMKAVQRFQEAVLATIDEVDPNVRRKIIDRLNERRAVSDVLRYTECTVQSHASDGL